MCVCTSSSSLRIEYSNNSVINRQEEGEINISLASGYRISQFCYSSISIFNEVKTVVKFRFMNRFKMIIPPMPWHRPRVRRNEGERVVLLHGLWRSVWAMEEPARGSASNREPQSSSHSGRRLPYNRPCSRPETRTNLDLLVLKPSTRAPGSG